MFNLLFFLVTSFIFSFDYSYDEKAIANLKNKSELLINSANYELALDIYITILDIEKTIYSNNDIELAMTYDKIAEI